MKVPLEVANLEVISPPVECSSMVFNSNFGQKLKAEKETKKFSVPTPYMSWKHKGMFLVYASVSATSQIN